MKGIRKTPTGLVLEFRFGEIAALKERLRKLQLPQKPTRYAADRALNDELRSLLDADLRAKRAARFESFLAGLEQSARGRVHLTTAQVDEWVAVLTDLRLLLAEDIGIEDEHWERSFDFSKPVPENVRLYLYLTALQSALIEHGFGISFDQFM